MLTDKDVTEQIIGAAIAVHRSLGPGYLESVYEGALAIEFLHQQIPFERQKIVPVFYRDQKVAEHRLDFLVKGAVVVELKAITALEDIHFAVVRSYLKATGLHAGLLLNFATMPLTIKRVGREDAARKPLPEKFLIS
jgi:GxxExxY protein